MKKETHEELKELVSFLHDDIFADNIGLSTVDLARDTVKLLKKAIEENLRRKGVGV